MMNIHKQTVGRAPISRDGFSMSFPAIRGVQAGREYYASMCPFRLLAKLFIFDEELMPELRAQRTLNWSRIPGIAQYVLSNPTGYVFSAITASIDGDIKFEPVSGTDPNQFRVGVLKVSMDAKLIVNDGQHRRAAIQQIIATHPNVGDETIAVVFFVDRGLERCQQMFADLNQYAVKPSPSLNILYDHRSATAQLAKRICAASTVFRESTEYEKTNLSARSRNLFTLSALYSATLELYPKLDVDKIDEAVKWSAGFWDEVGNHMPEWRMVRESRLSAGEVRQSFIHSHAIVLHALGRVGFGFVGQPRSHYAPILARLKKIDWSRKNKIVWEGRAMIGGSVAKAHQNIAFTTSYIKTVLKLPLTKDELAMEKSFKSMRRLPKARK